MSGDLDDYIYDMLSGRMTLSFNRRAVLRDGPARQRLADKLAEIYVDGPSTIREISELTGISITTTRTLIVEGGAKLRPRGPRLDAVDGSHA